MSFSFTFTLVNYFTSFTFFTVPLGHSEVGVRAERSGHLLVLHNKTSLLNTLISHLVCNVTKPRRLSSSYAPTDLQVSNL